MPIFLFGAIPALITNMEARIKALEENLEYVNQRLCDAQSEINQNLRNQAEKLKREEDVRIEADQELRKKLEATETGGLHISAMGVLWLFVGVIMSTVPVELARLFR